MKIIRVTFDSNVWRKVASPSKFPREPFLVSYQKINAACRSGAIHGLLSETTFTLEQIKREDRLAWLKSSGKKSVSITKSDAGSDVIKIQVRIGSSNDVVPKISKIVQEHLDDAYEIGIRVLRSKRIANPQSSLLKDRKYFLNYSSDEEYHQYNEKNGEIVRDLGKMGVGIANIKGKGQANSFGKDVLHWLKGIGKVPGREKEVVAELVAEWADADAIATSIAHDVVYFCTNDIGKGASGKGVVSAMSPEKAKAITARYGIQFISPIELVQKLYLWIPCKNSVIFS